MSHIANDFKPVKKTPVNPSGAVQNSEPPRQPVDASPGAVAQEWWWSAAGSSRPVYGPYEI
jgi:hypothetical protein